MAALNRLRVLLCVPKSVVDEAHAAVCGDIFTKVGSSVSRALCPKGSLCQQTASSFVRWTRRLGAHVVEGQFFSTSLCLKKSRHGARQCAECRSMHCCCVVLC